MKIPIAVHNSRGDIDVIVNHKSNGTLRHEIYYTSKSREVPLLTRFAIRIFKVLTWSCLWHAGKVFPRLHWATAGQVKSNAQWQGNNPVNK